MANNQPTEIVTLSVSKKNATGGTLVAGTIVKLGATDDLIVAATAATDVLFGVVRADIADGTWGDVLVHGRARVLASGAITLGARVTATTGGKAAAVGSTGGTNYSPLGLAEQAGATDTLFYVALTGPGQSFQG